MNQNLFSRVLVMVDGSETATAAAHFAVRLAHQTGGTLDAIYVVDTATIDGLVQMRIFVAEERRECEQDLERTGARCLEYVKAIGRKHSLEVKMHLRKGSVPETVLQTIRDLNADVLVLGGWCQRVSHTDATCTARQLILADASCPVIVIKPAPPV